MRFLSQSVVVVAIAVTALQLLVIATATTSEASDAATGLGESVAYANKDTIVQVDEEDDLTDEYGQPVLSAEERKNLPVVTPIPTVTPTELRNLLYVDASGATIGVKKALSGSNGQGEDGLIIDRPPNILVIDTRSAEDFISQGSIPGSVFLGIDGALGKWMPVVFPPEKQKRKIVFVSKDPTRSHEIYEILQSVGYAEGLLVGELKGGYKGWAKTFPELIDRGLKRISPAQLAELRTAIENSEAALAATYLPTLNVVDVRTTAEVKSTGVWRGAGVFPLSPSSIQSLSTGANSKPSDASPDLFIYCGSGYRSLVAASALRSLHGYRGNIVDVRGGYTAMAQRYECGMYLDEITDEDATQ